MLSRARQRANGETNGETNDETNGETHDSIEVLMGRYRDWVETGDPFELIGGSDPDPATRNSLRRQSLMEALRAYTPSLPIPKTMEEIKCPCPVAVDDEHEIVCKAIDACDEYCGHLNAAPDPGFLCPVSHTALRDPVAAPDGHVYEKTFIETSKKAASVRMVQWTSPMTRMQWGETTSFPRSLATVTSMRFWVILKAVELAGAQCTDEIGFCAQKLIAAVGERQAGEAGEAGEAGPVEELVVERGSGAPPPRELGASVV